MDNRPTNLHTIERIDNNKGYSKENCKWATRKEQARNRRSNRIIEFRGSKQLLIDWSIQLKVEYSKLRQFLKKHSFKEAFEFYSN